MFSLAVESGKLAYQPKVPMLKENNARTGFFEPEQFESVRKHLPEHLRPLVTFMYVTGWRRSEVASLRVASNRLPGQGSPTRIQARRRTMRAECFPFTVELRELLDAQHAEHEQLKKAGVIEPWVFWEMRGKSGSRTDRRATQRPRRDRELPKEVASTRAALLAARDASRTTLGGRRCGISCAPAFPSAWP